MFAGTIVASNFAGMAAVLGTSFLRHHPEARFAVLVVDEEPVDVPDGCEVVRLDDLDLTSDVLDVMRTIYDVREFATSVKPAFLRTLLRSDDVVCYLDPDIFVYAPFADVVEPVAEHGIVVTPHVLEPVPRDGLDPSERTLMLSGLFNLGFLGVGPGAVEFLDWWQSRLVTDAVIDFDNALFTDQRWVDWLPSLFPYTASRDRGMNVAWWNLHERPLELVDGAPFTCDRPVRFIHFSGYDPATPDVFCKWQPTSRVGFGPESTLRRLADEYGRRLVDAGHLEHKSAPYAWRNSADGVELTAPIRAAWREAFLAGDDPPPAFGERSGGLRSWLEAVVGGTDEWPHARIERLVWERRADLRAAFPAIDGADAERFRDWLDFEPDAWRELDGFSPACADRSRQRPSGAGPSTTVSVVDRARGVAGRVRHGARAGAHRVRERVARSSDPPTGLPFAFLHVPKCAGSSLRDAVRDAFPDASWAPWTFDPSQFGPLRATPLTLELAAQTIDDPSDLVGYQAAFGHYSLGTLLDGFDASEVVTILREPRTRLLSHHEFWRSLSRSARDASGPWADMTRTAERLDFGAWLREPGVAYQTDNLFIRQLASGHPAIPTDGFIDDEHVDELVEVGVDQLRHLGWVDVVERGSAMWSGLERRLGVELRPTRHNVTPDGVAAGYDVECLLGDETTNALASRTRIDAELWTWVARRRGVRDPAGAAALAWNRRVRRLVA